MSRSSSALSTSSSTAFVERGEADGLHDLAMPMAIAFSMQQLQVDDLDMGTIKRWGSAYLSQFSLTNTREDMIAAAHELM